MNGQDTVWSQLLQFYTNSFKTSLVFCTWSEDMYVVWNFGYNPQNILLTFFSQVELSHFSGIIYNKVNGWDTVWAQLLLHFYTNSFETSLVFWSWSEDMHVVWIMEFSLVLHTRENSVVFNTLDEIY